MTHFISKRLISKMSFDLHFEFFKEIAKSLLLSSFEDNFHVNADNIVHLMPLNS